MNSQQRTTSLLLAFLAVPFAIAVYQDATGTARPVSEFERILAASDALDDMPELEARAADWDIDDDAEVDALLAQLADEASGPSVETFLEDVFFENRSEPGFTGPLQGLALGQSRQALEQLFPTYLDWEYEGVLDFSERYDVGATIIVDFLDDKVARIEMQFDEDESKISNFTQHWGDATRASSGVPWSWYLGDSHFSYESNYGDGTVVLEQFQTLNALISPSSELFSFEEKSVLSLSEREVKLLPYYNEVEGRSLVPFVRGSQSTEPLYYALEDGRVSHVMLELVLDERRSKQALRMLERKFGTATVDDEDEAYLFKQGARHIRWACSEEGDDVCQLSIAREW